MGATMKVPAMYVGSMRAAALYEVDEIGKWLLSSKDEAERALIERSDGAVQLDDVRAALSSLNQDVTLLEALMSCPDGDVELEAEASVLAHVAESMARQVTTPKLDEQLSCGPIVGTEHVVDIRMLTDELGWAAGEAARLHAIAGAELQVRRPILKEQV